MIESIEFTNFKALRKTTLPLSPFTLLLGPNGSGKTSVLQALRLVANMVNQRLGNPLQPGVQSEPLSYTLLSITAPEPSPGMEIKLRLRFKSRVVLASFQIQAKVGPMPIQFHYGLNYEDGNVLQPVETKPLELWLAGIRTYSLDAIAIAQPVPVNSGPLQQNGSGLVAVLDALRDNHPERWELLLAEMRHWLPEYDHILFDSFQQGQKAIALRTKKGGHRIPAKDLSQGTLIALALLTMAYLPEPPSLVGLEEIDRGLHPRLLRHLQDALYRLSYPKSCKETRPPIQVIATTHSPYLLDLYRDHPEEVVLAQKQGLEVEMKRLSEIEHFGEILGDSPLSEVWYSGVLGGASVKP
jgi:predicted ATPase